MGSVQNACEISRANKNKQLQRSNSYRHNQTYERRNPKNKEKGTKKNLGINDQPTVFAVIVLRDFSQCKELSVATHLPICPETAEKLMRETRVREGEEKGECSNE